MAGGRFGTRAVARLVVGSAGALAMLAWVAPAAAQQADDRWEADAVEAVATLPLPGGVTALESAMLACSGNAWTMVLAVGDSDGEPPVDGPVTIDVDGRAFASTALASERLLRIAVSLDAIEPLKAGQRLMLDFDGDLEALLGDPSFSLRGSRLAITAVEDRCPPPDMSGYDAVGFAPAPPDLELARTLRAADIAAFTQATASEPEAAAAMVELSDGRRLFFTRLCGSSWYYGLTGCNVTGFALAGAQGDIWRTVYDTEGVHLYLDRSEAADGWPDLVTMPMRGRGEPRRWHWDGDGYVLVQAMAAGWELRVPIASDEAGQ